MPGWRVGVAVDLDQHKAAWIVRLLNHVKPGDSRLLDTLPGVFQRSGDEGVNALGLDVDENVNDQHGEFFHQGSSDAFWQEIQQQPAEDHQSKRVVIEKGFEAFFRFAITDQVLLIKRQPGCDEQAKIVEPAATAQ